MFRLFNKIEHGQQLGIEKRIHKNQKDYWYSYAVQKKGDIYYVYECEIADEYIGPMLDENYEYEEVYKYLSIEDVKNNFPCKYGTHFEDIHVLKGQRIFNVNFYI